MITVLLILLTTTTVGATTIAISDNNNTEDVIDIQSNVTDSFVYEIVSNRNNSYSIYLQPKLYPIQLTIQYFIRKGNLKKKLIGSELTIDHDKVNKLYLIDIFRKNSKKYWMDIKILDESNIDKKNDDKYLILISATQVILITILLIIIAISCYAAKYR